MIISNDLQNNFFIIEIFSNNLCRNICYNSDIKAIIGGINNEWHKESCQGICKKT